jgi:hypothetical protein
MRKERIQSNPLPLNAMSIRSDASFKFLIVISAALVIVNFFVESVWMAVALACSALLLAVSSTNKGSTAKTISTAYLATTLFVLIVEFWIPTLRAFARILIAIVMGLVILGAGKAYSITTDRFKLRKLVSIRINA